MISKKVGLSCSARMSRCLQITSGEEGWRTDGGANSSWIVNGTKGVDFVGNLELLDFATVHLCEQPCSPLNDDSEAAELQQSPTVAPWQHLIRSA